jgi:hypothetical protein
LNTQHLLLGVPQQPEGAARPTHFDQIDDRTARCVSGNSLSPGVYPVGIYIPHPSPTSGDPSASFHLINCSTPRLWLRYQLWERMDNARRHQVLSRRTVDWYIARGRLLTEREVEFFRFGDMAEASRLASWVFATQEDEPSPPAVAHPLDERLSRHGLLAFIMAEGGTSACIPGLTKALAEDRFLPPTPEAPGHYGWVAAFTIARLEPWAEVDDWLAGQLERREAVALRAADAVAAPEPVFEPSIILPPGVPPMPEPSDGPGPRNRRRPMEEPPPRKLGPAPEVGATAAAILVQRRGVDPGRFRLEASECPEVHPTLEFQGYRFQDEAGRKALLKWWADEGAGMPVILRPADSASLQP